LLYRQMSSKYLTLPKACKVFCNSAGVFIRDL
jgi:hypothetical protein